MKRGEPIIDTAPTTRDLSARRIIGFACNQAFVFHLLYLGAPLSLTLGDITFARVDLVVMLLFMVLGFVAVRALVRWDNAHHLRRLFARPALYIYAVIAAGGALLPLLLPDIDIAALAGKGVLVGIACALLLTAWGRAFGCEGTRVSVPEVFLGTLVAAIVCLVFSLASDSVLLNGAICLLPLASVVNIDIPTIDNPDTTPSAGSARSSEARTLSIKIMFGTALFGLAAGLMQLFSIDAQPISLPAYQVSMVLLAAFLIGGLTLLLSDGFGHGAALNKSYRLAVFVMMIGVLLVPWPPLQGTLLPGESVVMAGYLGLEAVLVSLFLVIAAITGDDCALSFSAGFLSLFVGELVGTVISSALPGETTMVVLGGAVILLSYVFLFTERDFDDLSSMVSEDDSFERTCQAITRQYGLSNRESEILTYALRGRTNERIAQELVIAKSTVDTHLRRIYSKCGVHSRQELLDLAETIER